MVGKFVMQKITTLPTFLASRDEGRLVYDENNQSVYYGTETQWVKFESDSSLGQVDFTTMGTTTTVDPDDHLLIDDHTNTLNKKITLSDFLSNLDIDSNLDELTEADADDYLLVYDTSTSQMKKLLYGNSGGGASGIGTIVIDTHKIDLDDSDDAEFGSFLGMYRTIDFAKRSDGSCWFNFPFPDNWSTSSDITFELFYNLSGAHPAKNVNLTMKMWSVVEGDEPDLSTPDQTTLNTITSSTSNTGKLTIDSLTNIANANITSDTKSIIIKLTRDVSEDTYNGTLQIVNMGFAQ